MTRMVCREELRRLGIFMILAAVCCVTQPTLVSALLPAAPFRYYHFNIELVNYTVNCQTKPTLTANGQFPGPPIYANEGDRMIVNVTNSSPDNITIHFHGVRQLRSPWMDGVAYVTMCPIQPGDYFVHDFHVPLQQGTLLWHAHYKWMRATVHGAFITYPQVPAPYKAPHGEFPLVFAEWWYGDVQQIEDDHLRSGSIFPDSDAMTINGHPGPTYNCSQAEGARTGVTTLSAHRGKTYLLRLVNAALNTHLFFAIANHTLTVVEADGEYVQPFTTSLVLLSPGQTTNVLVTADQPGGTYYMSITGYGRDNIPLVRPVALFQYRKPSPLSDYPFAPYLPKFNDTGSASAFTSALRTLNVGRVPLTVDRSLFLVVSLTTRLCNRPGDNCTTSLYAIQGAVNNITLDLPSISLLQASYFNISGVYTEDFPDYPLFTFNYTGVPSPPPAARISVQGTRIIPVKYNDTVQIILQDTTSFGFENHPFHLHGHNFYIVGQGFGNYDPGTDPASFNLWDPPLRNTVGVPYGGWAAIRVKFFNPGMWLFHCHLDKHTSWGMQTVFHVFNGPTTNSSILPPPSRLVQC